MISNAINLVELQASEGYLLTDKDKTNTFKKIICKQSEVDNFIEISEAEAEEIMKEKEENIEEAD